MLAVLLGETRDMGNCSRRIHVCSFMSSCPCTAAKAFTAYAAPFTISTSGSAVCVRNIKGGSVVAGLNYGSVPRSCARLLLPGMHQKRRARGLPTAFSFCLCVCVFISRPLRRVFASLSGCGSRRRFRRPTTTVFSPSSPRENFSDRERERE